MLSHKSMKFLKQLIAIRTVTGDHIQQKKAIDLINKNIIQIFKRRSFYAKGYCSKLFYSDTSNIFDVLFVVHCDVVDGADELFLLKEKNDKLYGRGVFDMKGPLIATIDAVNHFFEDGKKKISVGILVTFDEEAGGHNGVKMFLKKNNITAGVVIVPDGGDDINQIVTEEKGVVEVEISCKGVSAHASRPWEGINAVTKIINSVKKITDHFPGGDGSQWKTIASLISIRSETVADNAIPHFASAKIMFRYVKKDSVDKIIKFIVSIDHSLIITILKQGDAMKTSPKNYFVTTYRAVVKKHTKKTCTLTKYHSACDARYFSALGIPVIIARPCGGGAHAKNEWISKDQLNTFSDILYKYLMILESLK